MRAATKRTAGREVGVRLIRGPFIALQPHQGHLNAPDLLPELCSSLRSGDSAAMLAADLFSGAGGLSLGLAQAGAQVVLGVDHYAEAVETHAHHFQGVSTDWDLADAEVVERVSSLMRKSAIDILCGGPPCQPFSKAGRSKIRHRVRLGERDPHDQRRDLWRSFVEIVRLAGPRAVIMENVPDMALDREMFIFRAIVHELEQAGYAVHTKIMNTSQFGVPQFRQRLIIVALARGIAFNWPEPDEKQVTLWNAIGDLPEVEGGWRPHGGQSGWIEYSGSPTTAFQKRMRRGVPRADRHKLYDHITRPVRPDDARAFDLMDSETKYSDLPEDLKRYRDDIFDDKYKRLDEDALSRTITAHIAKDGYWYIHPRQPRTLTVREAARIQTFPDWYRFAGGPTAAFKQIGNAVPPALGYHLGKAVLRSLEEGALAGPTTGSIAQDLATWFQSTPNLTKPWLRAKSRWQALVALMLLSRATPSQIRDAWPITSRWRRPSDTMQDRAVLTSLGSVIGRPTQAERILQLGVALAEDDSALNDDEAITEVQGLSRSISELCVLTVPPPDEADGEQPIVASQPSLRVAARYTGQPVDRQNRLTDGRIALARMIGAGSESRTAQLAIIEIANSICRPADPKCDQCPLASNCAEVRNRARSLTATPTLGI